jgi:hypothetical protein
MRPQPRCWDGKCWVAVKAMQWEVGEGDAPSNTPQKNWSGLSSNLSNTVTWSWQM